MQRLMLDGADGLSVATPEGNGWKEKKKTLKSFVVQRFREEWKYVWTELTEKLHNMIEAEATARIWK